MAMLDGVISDLSSRFGLGDKARQLIGYLLSYITRSPGGLAGFIEKLRQAGLGSILGGRGEALTGDQVRGLMGGEVDRIASRLGVSESTTASAIGAALPAVVSKVAPGGSVPTTLPAEVSNLVQSVGGTATEYGSRAAGAARDTAQSAWNWLAWALPLLGLALLTLYLVQSCGTTSSTNPSTGSAPTNTSAVTAPEVTRASDEVRALFNSATEALSEVKDVPTAEAALPRLQALVPKLDEAKATTDKLPTAGRESLRAVIGPLLAKFRDMVSKVLAMPGVGDKLKPILDQIMAKFSALAPA
jgi:uncharacterized protein YidB (DUF937 family)